MGLVAAVTEMLVQSHTAGVVVLLPALPASLAQSGHISGVRLRGSSQVSLAWSQGRVTAADLRFDSWHPWWMGMDEEQTYPGFFR